MKASSTIPTAVAEPRYVSVKQAAAYLQVNEWSIRQMIIRGDLTAFRYGPRLLRVDLTELDALLAAGTTR